MIQRHTLLRLAIASALVGASGASLAGFIIDSEITASQTLDSGVGQVTAAGKLSVGGGEPAIDVIGSSSIDNAGTIEQTGDDRAIDANTNDLTLDVTNQAGALIESADGDSFRAGKPQVSVSLINEGTIRSNNASAGGAQAIDWSSVTDAPNTLDNRSGARIEATAADAVRPGVDGEVNNAGIISALPVVEGSTPNREPSGSDGIDAQDNPGISVTNTGAISGRHGITGGDTGLGFTITVDNQAGGTITGVNGSGINIDGDDSRAKVTNRGTILGQFDSANYDIGDGDGVDVDGLVDIDNYGVIRGINATAPSNPEGVSIGGGLVINHAGAEISGNSNLGNGPEGHGLLVDNSDGGNAFAALDLTNAGLIRGYQGYAVKAIGSFADTVNNQAGGVLRGAGTEAALQTGGGDDRVTNAGTVQGDGGMAIDLGNGNDTLTIQGGAARVMGSIFGGGGSDNLILDPGIGERFAYDGTISEFDGVDLTSGSAALAGSVNAILSVGADAVLAPGNSVGTLDLNGLVLAATSVLEIEIDPTNSQGNGFNDLIRVSGAVDLGLAELMINLLSAPTLGEGFDILLNDGDDPVVGGRPGPIYADFGGLTYRFDVNYSANADGGTLGNDVRVTASGVPVPGVLWLMGLGCLGLAGWARRRQTPLAVNG